LTNRAKQMPRNPQDQKTNENPKLDPNPPTNMEKEPDQWVSGDDPMTGAQASYLKTLAEEAGDPDAYDENLTQGRSFKTDRCTETRVGIGIADTRRRQRW
jgi:DUF3072 family protein